MLIPFYQKEKSIDDFVGSEGETRLATLLIDNQSPDPMDRLYTKEVSSLVNEAMDVLSDRERVILEGRFGLAGEDEMTLEAIGKKLGLSRERVRQLERDAKHKLQSFLLPRRRDLHASLA